MVLVLFLDSWYMYHMKKINICLRCGITAIKKDLKHGLHKECFQKTFNLKDVDANFVDLIVKNSSEKEQAPLLIASSFFHGAFKKYAGKIEGQRYIIKVQQADYKELPIVEYVSNLMARDLGIKVADFHYIHFNNALPTFVTRNILDDYVEANLVHIWHYLKDERQDKYKDLSLKNVIEILQKETQRPIDVKNFIEICLFDMTIGNHDRHGRNLALIETVDGKVLAPFYDNPSYIGIENEAMLGAEISARGKIATSQTNEPLLIDYIEEFNSLGYEEIVTKFINKLRKYDFQKVLKNSNLSLKRRKAFKDLINKNLKTLEEESR